MVFLGFAAVAACIILFVVWRIFASVAGSRKRSIHIVSSLNPLIALLQADKPVDATLVSDIARKPELRTDLYQLLKYHGKVMLFPGEYLSRQSMGEAALAYWLLHPNELGVVPSEIVFAGEVIKAWAGKPVVYTVHKFMNPNSRRWEAGVAGPFLHGQAPYAGYPGTFSTFSAFETQTPEGHAERVHRIMLERKMYRGLK